MKSLKVWALIGSVCWGSVAFSQSTVLAPPQLLLEQRYSDFSAVQKEWLLATAALLTIANGHPANDLSEGFVGQFRIDAAKQILRGWKVYNKTDLISAIRLVRERGHRFGFDYLVRKLPGMSPQELRQMIERDKYPELLEHRIRVVQKFSPSLGGKGIFCFDLVRIVSLAKWGYMAGMLTEQEAWDIIGPTGIHIQGFTSSWQELAHQYRVGRLYLELDPKGEVEAKFDNAQAYLLGAPDSPWQRLPWGLSLERAAVN